MKALDIAMERDAAICVGSPWHEDELALLGSGPTLNANVRTLRTYTRDLRMKFDNELISAELFAAAREFCEDREPLTWREAFRDDPDNPPLNAFQTRWMNEQYEVEGQPSLVDEAEHDRRTSEGLTAAHIELRGNYEWSEIAEGNLKQQIRHYLAPLADPDYCAAYGTKLAKQAALVMATGDTQAQAGSALLIYTRFAEVAYMANVIRERFPKIQAEPRAFCESEAVCNLPTMRLVSFLLAALSADGKRISPQRGDLHDLWHLTYGLSRCDIVTADRRSCELARGRGLVPSGVALFEGHHGLDEAAAAIEAL